jgi:hypothetical protein
MAKAGGGEAVGQGVVVAEPGTGRFIGTDALTKKQTDFVRAYVANGGKGKDAAIAAGYEHPSVDSWRLMRNQAVLQGIRAENARRVLAEGGTVGVDTLLEVARDRAQTGAARVSAAKELVRMAGLAEDGRSAGEPDDRPLAERTLAELEAFISGGMDRLRAMESDQERTIDGQLVPVLPHDAPDTHTGDGET